MKKKILLLLLSLNNANLLYTSEGNETTDSQVTNLFSSQNDYSYHQSQEDAQINDGYSQWTHSPLPHDNDWASSQSDGEVELHIISQNENQNAQTLQLTDHNNHNPIVRIVTLESDQE